MRIIVHIGAHKTASTHLQMAMGRAGDRLKARGVAYFGPEALRRRGLGVPEYLSAGAEDPDHAERIRAALADQPPDRPRDRLVLSDENLLGNAHNVELIRTARLYPRAPERLARLAPLLPAGEVVLALAIRNPAGFLASAYAQRLMSGRLQTYSDYAQGLDPARLSWADLIERVMAALPRATCHVWRYEDYPANAPEVLCSLLGEAAPAARPGPGIAHPGLSARAHAALMAEAPALAMRGEEAVRERVKALRAAWPKDVQSPGLQPHDPATLLRATASYTADCARIAALPGVHALWREAEGRAKA
ncbi:MAG TPA: hypothetical protein GX700_08465 [Paracoccus sp.]|nr:hypothetical protein [Paracoccus sp. (in: a-proteobacteria)]